MISSLIRNVSHSSRCAPLSTVNFATKPRRPVGATAGTSSSGALIALIASPTASASKLQHVCEKLPRVERREVIDIFASADEARWNSKFVLNCHDDAALAAAVELGDNETSESNCA